MAGNWGELAKKSYRAWLIPPVRVSPRAAGALLGDDGNVDAWKVQHSMAVYIPLPAAGDVVVVDMRLMAVRYVCLRPNPTMDVLVWKRCWHPICQRMRSSSPTAPVNESHVLRHGNLVSSVRTLSWSVAKGSLLVNFLCFS